MGIPSSRRRHVDAARPAIDRDSFYERTWVALGGTHASLAGCFSPSQLGFAALLAYVVMPQVSTPLAEMARTLVVRMWKKLSDKSKAMLALAIQAFIRAAKIEVKMVPAAVIDPAAV